MLYAGFIPDTFMDADLMLNEEVIKKVVRGHLLGLICTKKLNSAHSAAMVAKQILLETP